MSEESQSEEFQMNLVREGAQKILEYFARMGEDGSKTSFECHKTRLQSDLKLTYDVVFRLERDGVLEITDNGLAKINRAGLEAIAGKKLTKLSGI